MRTLKKIISIKKFAGSALILAVVLSSLLAMVGVLFVMVARMNKMATSAIAENMELNLAVDTVVAKVSQQLVSDVPGTIIQEVTDTNTVDPNATDPNTPDANSTVRIEEYYDYPDANNLWLADLEPYQSGSDYYWGQISDITGSLAGANRNIRADIISEYDPVTDVNISFANIANADADGDGVGDSKWVKLDDISSGQGKSIYAAVRIIDNGAMLNVNTGFKFDSTDPNATPFELDGTNQLQINLMALADRPGDPHTQAQETNLLLERANSGTDVNNANPWDLSAYLQNVIWRYDDPYGPYTPFDLSDELELRYRYILNHTAIDTRLENWCGQLRTSTLSTPVTNRGQELDAWFQKATCSGSSDPNYNYRHIATIYNMDRIINPAGAVLNNGKMINVNLADKNYLYSAIRAGLRYGIDPNDPNSFIDLDGLAAQLAVNIFDLRDSDANATALTIDSKTYYGFEAQPFISEIAFRINSDNPDISNNNYFAVELYNPFKVDVPLSNFSLELRDANNLVVANVTNQSGYVMAANSRFVITNNSYASSEFGLNTTTSTGRVIADTNLVLARYVQTETDPPEYELSERYNIYLRRITPHELLYIDRQNTRDDLFTWNDVKDISQFYCRNDDNCNFIYQDISTATNTLGAANGTTGAKWNYNLIDSGYFTSAGEIAKTLTIGPSSDPNDMPGLRLADEPLEAQVRIDLQNPVYTNIFQYLTAIDPVEYVDPVENIDPNNYTNYQEFFNETRIKGRININTAPWYVITQLPWMFPAIAQDIIAYRNAAGAFESIAELMYVQRMGLYANDELMLGDLNRWPDLTPNDGAADDFEERDIIFSRISNLVTVRSDVFTAYILVRIGTNGPQKRVVAILDRSRVSSGSDKVRILAVHPVPDPR